MKTCTLRDTRNFYGREKLEFTLKNQNTKTEIPHDLSKAIPILNPLVEVRTYRWPVHQICREFSSPQKIRGNYSLVVYRDPKTLKVGFVEGNRMVADLIYEMKLKKKSLQNILTKLASKNHVRDLETFVLESVKTLDFLFKKGILMGFLNSRERDLQNLA